MKKILLFVTAAFAVVAILFISFGRRATVPARIAETSVGNNSDITTDTGESTSVNTPDIDLTSMSSTMVYSNVSRMMISPEDYEGRIIKMRGSFNTYYGYETGIYYPAVIIADAAACCSQGLEFVLDGEPAYPSGYPELMQEITVIGRFEVYYEGAEKYCHLVSARIL